MKIIRRLNKEEEYTLMYPSTNVDNLKKFKDKLLPYFFYNTSSSRRIKSRLKNNNSDFKNDYLDKLLKLNAQKRAFFSIENDSQTDGVYKEYRNEIFKKFTNSPADFSKIRDDIDARYLYTLLIDYNTYISNKITIGKQTYKLFKFLIDSEIISEEFAKKITTHKSSKEMLYLCITRNPIDYLFASTNQSFESCISLNRCGDMVSLGLAGLTVDPNRFMIFLTKGKLKRHQIRNQEIKHFSYISRWWCLLGKRDFILPMYDYPGKCKESVQRDVIEQLLLKSSEAHDSDFRSKFSFEPVKFQNGDTAMVYLDRIGINYNERGEIFYDGKGETGSIHRFDSSVSYYDIDYFDDLEKGRRNCDLCGESTGDNLVYTEGDGTLCEYCWGEHYFYCEDCDSDHPREDALEGVNGESLCVNCWNNKYYSCETCNKAVRHNDSYIGADRIHCCEDCWNEYNFFCEECGEVTDIDDRIEDNESKEYCYSCYNNLVTSCCKCDTKMSNDEISNDGIFIDLKDHKYCKDCYLQLYTNCKICDEEIEREYLHCVTCITPNLEIIEQENYTFINKSI